MKGYILVDNVVVVAAEKLSCIHGILQVLKPLRLLQLANYPASLSKQLWMELQF